MTRSTTSSTTIVLAILRIQILHNWMLLIGRKLLHTPGKQLCYYRILLSWYPCVGAEDQNCLKRIWQHPVELQTTQALMGG